MATVNDLICTINLPISWSASRRNSCEHNRDYSPSHDCCVRYLSNSRPCLCSCVSGLQLLLQRKEVSSKMVIKCYIDLTRAMGKGVQGVQLNPPPN